MDEDKRGRDDNIILIFTVNNEAGALANAINIIGKFGFNMKVLRSRPIKDADWEYYFYVELEGNECSDEGRQMLSELKDYCHDLKIVGHYSGEKKI
jgi:chorismate mutase/prephenate dehydratase